MYEHNALGFWSGLALCLTKVRSSRARCPATALMMFCIPVNSYGHVGTLPPFLGLLPNIGDVMTSKMCFK